NLILPQHALLTTSSRVPIRGSRFATPPAASRQPRDLRYTRRTTDVELVNRITGSARRSREVGESPTRCRHCKRGAAFYEPATPAATVRDASAWEGQECCGDPQARILDAGLVLFRLQQEASAREHAEK